MTTTATATGDITAVTTLTDDELAAEITAADIRFARVRSNDPRRVTLSYHDAKLAVSVFTAERRRREEAAAVAEAEAIVAEAASHICPPACTAALSHASLCECRCHGANHGADHREGRARALATGYGARRDRAGGVMALLASMGGLADDDEPF